MKLSNAAQVHDDASLRITLLQNDPSKPAFEVQLQNVGDHDFVLNLGMMLDNATKQYLDQVRLSLTDTSSGKVIHLELRESSGIAGGMAAPLNVPLAVGARFIFPVNLGNYVSLQPNIGMFSLTPGTYRLRAEYSEVDIHSKRDNTMLFPFWGGSIRSPEVTFKIAR
jgi:hypothetical protein